MRQIYKSCLRVNQQMKKISIHFVLWGLLNCLQELAQIIVIT